MVENTLNKIINKKGQKLNELKKNNFNRIFKRKDQEK